jgi:hypothetical protein
MLFSGPTLILLTHLSTVHLPFDLLSTVEKGGGTVILEADRVSAECISSHYRV